MSKAVTVPPRTDDFNEVAGWLNEVYLALNLVGTVTVDVGSIAAGGVGTFTIPFPGVLVGIHTDVMLGPPAAVATGLIWTGFVSANDTVTVRLHNTTGGPIDPASAVWTCRVIR